MRTPIIIHKGRTVVVTVGLGYDVSGDTISSEIRTEQDSGSDLIAEWDVTFFTDGTDGELVLTLDDSVTMAILRANGYMDLKRVTGGEPISILEEPIPVVIKGVVTA